MPILSVNFLGIVNWGEIMRSDVMSDGAMRSLLLALTPPNRYALLVSMTTGLRIGDCLSIKTEQVKKGRFTVVEEKTGKRRQVRLGKDLQDAILSQCAGKVYAFPGRIHPHTQHRTRQAVYKDIKRACTAFRLPAELHISPHSARKVYAVREFRRTCDINRVRSLLNHSDEAVTMLYAMADALTDRHLSPQQRERLSGQL